MKRLFVLIACMAFATAAAAQTTERLVDAGKVFPMLEKFLAIPPADRSKLALGYIVVQDGKPPSDLHLTLVADGRRTPLPIADGGRVGRLPTAADFAAHAQVAIDAPKGAKFGSRLDLSTNIKPAQDISASDCALAVVQANAAIQRVAGVMAMLAPHLSKVIFLGAAGGVAIAADGKSQPLPLVKGQPAYDPATVKDARVLRFSKAPASLDLE